MSGADDVVVRVLILDGGQVLLVQQADGWSLPGGRVLPGEGPAIAAAREIAEETQMVTHRLRLLGEWDGATGDSPPGSVQLHVYTAEVDPMPRAPLVRDADVLAVAWWPVDALPEMSERRGSRECVREIITAAMSRT